VQARFSDLVAICDLQQVLDSFSAAARISVEVMDLDGQTIAVIPGPNICSEFYGANSQSKQRCKVINGEIPSGLEDGSSISYTCLDGLFEHTHAIRIENQPLATLILGQVFHAPPVGAGVWFR
jgi:ligand-binding sensor protein